MRDNIRVSLCTLVVGLSCLLIADAAPQETSDPVRSEESLAVESGAEKVTIEVGTLAAKEAAEFILAEIEAFQQARPDIRILYSALDEPSRFGDHNVSPGRFRIPLSELSHLGRNITGISSEIDSEVYYLVSRNLLVPIDTFLPDPDFNYDFFYDNLWDAVTFQGKRWGIPLDCHSYAMLCDWALFEQAGISEPPKTWDEALEHARLLSRDGHIGLNLPLVYGEGEPYLGILWKTMVLQKGGHIATNGRFDLKHPALREAYDFIQYLRNMPGIVAEDHREIGSVLGDGSVRYGMHLVPSVKVKRTGGRKDLRFAGMPTFGRAVTADRRRIYLAIRKSSPEKEAASWEFIKWICRPDAWIPATPQRLTYPSRKDLLSWRQVPTLLETYPEGAGVIQEAKAWPVRLHELDLETPEAMDHFDTIIEALFAGQLTFEAAMGKAELECNEILRNTVPLVQPYELYR